MCDLCDLWWVIRSTVEVFITIIILLSWTTAYAGRDAYDLIDLFAGAARVARATRAAGMKAAALDLNYHRKPQTFSINASAGFLCLSAGGMTEVFVVSLYQCM